MTKSILTAVAALTSLAGIASADVLYSNPFDGTGNAFSSQNDTTGGNGNFATAYGFFTTGRDVWSVQDVHLVGEYFNPPQQGFISNFTVNIYADAGNAPGALLSSTAIPTTAFSETYIGDFGGFPAYRYDFNVTPTIVSGDAWVSVVPDMGFPPQWGWATGVDADPAHFGWQTFFGTPARLGSSLNIEITGEVVPAPAGLALLGLGGLVAGRRRR